MWVKLQLKIFLSLLSYFIHLQFLQSHILIYKPCPPDGLVAEGGDDFVVLGFAQKRNTHMLEEALQRITTEYRIIQYISLCHMLMGT